MRKPSQVDAEPTAGASAWQVAGAGTLADLARLLRQLRRRHARARGGAALTYRELAAATGWSHGIIGEYLTGRVLPPTERFDVLIRLLGAEPAEQGALATLRDQVEESRRRTLPGGSALPEVRVPRQLPVDVFGFTGRTVQLAELDTFAGRRRGPAVVVIAGTAGVGKTALAVHWAHQAAESFPDGQLYIDLRGYDPDRPVPPGDALAVLLRGLGVDGADIPADLAERSSCYRTVLADRRMLVVLDNAGGVEQVRGLLPGTPSCFALVTSRDDLAGLVAREGARRIDLDLLSTPEAVALLGVLIGPDVNADASAELAQRCARLPLALRIAAEFATAHPASTVAELLADLQDEQRRLDLLDATGDPRTAVRSVFSWSYQHLSVAAARAFRLLGLHPGRDIEAHAVAALVDRGPAGARALIDELARAHLIEIVGPGRYGMHDLLRAYAVELARACDPDAAREALSRLFDYYLGTAVAATNTLFPHERHRRPVVPPQWTGGPAVDEPDRASAWLDRQRPNLVAVASYAADHGWPRLSVDLSCALWRYFEVGGHYQEALAVHTSAAAAGEGEDPVANDRERVLANLGSIHWWLGNHREARTYFERSVAGHRQIDDPEGEALAMARLGLVHERLGDYPESLANLRAALSIYRRVGNRHGEGAQRINLGGLLRRMGRYAEAARQLRCAAALFVEIGDPRLEGYALGNLGAVYGQTGRYGEALGHLERALANCRATRDPGGEGSALGTMGAVYQRMGRYPEALEQLHRALAISRATADRSLETETLNTLGETLCGMGQLDSALTRHRAALALTERSDAQYEQARALDGIARVFDGTGDAVQGSQHRQKAAAIYRSLGVPEQPIDAGRHSGS